MNKSRINKIWKEIYGENQINLLDDFFADLDDFKKNNSIKNSAENWYKDVVVYSLYVDLFNNDFSGLEEKLDYISELGISCLWLLPILDSPMRDAGFDIRDYKKIRADLLKDKNQSKAFEDFIGKAHSKGIKVIFDIAINHSSEEHEWFQKAKSSKDNAYRDYYIWSETKDKYSDARIIFKGMEDSNWKQHGEEYYFHRFFDFQPDLNYRNPKVLIEMTDNFLYWIKLGVDGFRADAIPYLWKEEGTDCENLDKTHLIVKFFRAVFDYLNPNILLLAEAAQRPKEVVKYFGDGDECHAAYHFPLMPQIFKAIAAEDSNPIISTLSEKITPKIPDKSQWFIFLRCHDELSLEDVYVNEKDREFLYKEYCKSEQWDFREGQGISARLSELLDRNPDKIALAFSIMLSLPGTPVVYYGDEYGKLNDVEYYRDSIQKTGKKDSRFLVRGKVNWSELEKNLKQKNSFNSQVYSKVKTLIKSRLKTKAFGRGEIVWINLKPLLAAKTENILAFKRIYKDEEFLIINNLSNSQISLDIELTLSTDLLGNTLLKENRKLIIEPFAYYWIDFSKTK